MLIYLDESGDLGFDFSRGCSRYFVITLLVCEGDVGKCPFGRAVGRTLKNKLNRRGSRRRVEELKGAKTHLDIKKYFWKLASGEQWCLYATAVNKRRVEEHLTTAVGRKKFYNFMSRFVLERVDLMKSGSAVRLVVDKSKGRPDILDFNEYLQSQLESRLPLNVPLVIDHKRSQDDPGLQAVDLFCWGIYRRYEHDDSAWHALFKDRIAFETEYLPEK